MLEGSPSVVIVGEAEVARGEVSVDAGLSLSIRLAEVLGDLPAPGDEVVVRTFEAIRGRREYVVTVESVNQEMLVVTDIELISAFQQRAIVRVETDLPVTLVYEMIGDELVDAEIPIQGRMLDLSATGFSLFCSTALPEAYRFGFHFSTDFDEMVLVADAIRSEDVPRGHRYGCRFVGTTQREADALHRYVLSEQIAQRRRTDGL
ncbi:PilZ domain-containing protein [Pengzhenrongella frigida]|uniref:PilZ domain-containing protein n=1 Tax=Pengzhenrongella frigida TaxID=1259133 RepID=A0A4Q5N0G3_9MICO|nr:PilZ domain-containing protein [Cellulomonas sp. HLT2-17]RYV50703.1 PilZ domain-containing protein [Cellulomonas sp. HLT2-17]